METVRGFHGFPKAQVLVAELLPLAVLARMVLDFLSLDFLWGHSGRGLEAALSLVLEIAGGA